MWVIGALLEAAAVKIHAIPLVACRAAKLTRHLEGPMWRFVDAAVERCRLSIDRNDHREGRRRACLMRLLGELYNYRLLDSGAIFRVLYLLVPKAAGVWGHVVPLTHVAAHHELAPPSGPCEPPAEAAAGGSAAAPPAATPAGTPARAPSARPRRHPMEPMGDAPDDCGRLRCVCALLDTCGQYFSKGKARRYLDVYLVHLLRYTYCKAMSTEVEFALTDTLHRLRPKLVRPASYAEASELVQLLEERVASRANNSQGGGGRGGGRARSGGGGGGGGGDRDPYAHELLHTTREARDAKAARRAAERPAGAAAADAAADEEEEDDEDDDEDAGGDADAGDGDDADDDGGGGDDGDDGDDGEDGGGDDDAQALDAELADVERQLAELSAEDGGGEEGAGDDAAARAAAAGAEAEEAATVEEEDSIGYVQATKHVVSKEDEDEFDRMMEAMMRRRRRRRRKRWWRQRRRRRRRRKRRRRRRRRGEASDDQAGGPSAARGYDDAQAGCPLRPRRRRRRHGRDRRCRGR